jgi:type II secretory pathway component PulM
VTTYIVGVMLMAAGVITLLVIAFLYLTRQETNEVKRIFREIHEREEQKKSERS